MVTLLTTLIQIIHTKYRHLLTDNYIKINKLNVRGLIQLNYSLDSLIRNLLFSEFRKAMGVYIKKNTSFCPCATGGIDASSLNP